MLSCTMQALTPILLFMKARLLPLFSLTALLFFLFLSSTMAQNTTWRLDPVSSDWNNNANWTNNAPNDTGTFAVSNETDAPALSFLTGLNQVVFSPGSKPVH